MRNKSGILILTAIITLLCLYYLSFTLVSRNIQKDAIAYATDANGNINYSQKNAYLDSLWKLPVYNLLGLEYTYEEVKNTELSLGLDLQGGMHVTLEVSPVEIVRGISGNNSDRAFNDALVRAQQLHATSQESFIQLFYSAYKSIAPDRPLNAPFVNAANRGRIDSQTTDQEVLRVLQAEVNDAIDRSLIILRTRMDRFGTTQPNIVPLASGRIQIELPGADNPARVRELLQSVAKLEFWEVVEPQEISSTIQSINAFLVEEQKRQKPVASTPSAPVTSEQALQNMDTTSRPTQQELATSAEDLAAQLGGAQGDAQGIDTLMSEVSPFVSLLKSPYGLVYDVADTAKVNRILARSQVKALIPAHISFMWDYRGNVAGGSQQLELHAIRAGRANKAPLEGNVITNATQSLDQRSRPAVSMEMNTEGARKWRKLTGDNVGKRIAVVLDNYVLTAPNVQSEIAGGRSEITGNFTLDDAKDLANLLKAGSLPAPTQIVEEAIIGPTLGREAQAQGIISIVAGLVLVVVFMIAYYSRGGLIATLALVFNIFFILGILAQLNSALTLPGIAGIVLTIGMSIDANVLIFERIREELRNGMTLKQAISLGYDKAYSAIIDSNVTTFLTGIILYVLGQGPVKGFAITLMIGIACSFFSAVFITRIVVEWMAKRGDEKKITFSFPFSHNLLNNLNFNFLSKRKFAYIFSSVFITIGLVVLLVQGGLNFGVDFTGGRSYVVTFSKNMVASDVKVALTNNFENAGTEVKTYGADNVLKITTSYLINDESAEADNRVEESLIAGLSDHSGMSFLRNDAMVGDNNFTISSSSKVGASIANDIQTASLKAVAISLIVIFLYILVRFRKWQYGLGAITALFHDTLAVISAFAIAGLFGKVFEVDQVFIAAMLTVIGYSINDTVIVFDRIREDIGLRPKGDIVSTFNGAINNTMSRTLITSFTTLIVVIILLIFGGEVLRGFSFALLVGILVGTYSSIYIATPVVIDLSTRTVAKKQQVPA
ncbi:MAG: protein translocase subunit SecDF [Bacteroidota bacterium]|nr:protein translocase subunit SecDF [Bacteroidota bacterium]